MTQYVIPRYAPMCLVLAGIVVIQIVDNFPISTIDMIMSAFSAVSHQKRIANSCCPSSAPEESPFIKDDSEECQLNSDSALLTQGMATVDETNGATSEGMARICRLQQMLCLPHVSSRSISGRYSFQEL